MKTNISLNDGNWHHLAVMWEVGGSWHVFINATMAAKGTNLAANTLIQDDGYLVIGRFSFLYIIV